MGNAAEELNHKDNKSTKKKNSLGFCFLVVEFAPYN